MRNNEAYTNLNHNETVRKDHPEIQFRGILDGAIAAVCYGKALAYRENHTELNNALSEIQAALQDIMRAHVMKEAMPVQTLLGLTPEQLREMSHNPKAYFGIGQFLPSPEKGLSLAFLNIIRTKIRDAERAFIACFEDDALPIEIATALNRLSSAVFILMCREHSACEGQRE